MEKIHGPFQERRPPDAPNVLPDAQLPNPPPPFVPPPLQQQFVAALWRQYPVEYKMRVAALLDKVVEPFLRNV